jgi:adenylate kinase family enzyme
VCRVVGKAILDNPSECYLIDGFPREISQVDTFFKLARDADKVIYLDVDDENLMARAIKR